jgi:hypothetical protein
MAIYGGSNGYTCAYIWPYIGQPYREGREGIPYYSLLFSTPGKGITESLFLSLLFPGSLLYPGKGRDSLPYSAAYLYIKNIINIIPIRL